MRKLISLPIPEGGAEVHFSFNIHHRCALADTLAKELNNENIDLLVFYVGADGRGLPAGIPFPVVSTNPCGACGRGPFTQMFEWTKKLYLV